MRLPRICFVSMEVYATLRPGSTAAAGGAGFQLVELGKVLRDRGYPVSFVVGDFGQDRLEEVDGFELHRANRAAHDRSYSRAIRNLGRLWSAMRSARADVYVLRSTRFLHGQCWLFSRLLGARYGFMVANRSNCFAADREGVPGPLNRMYGHAMRHSDMVTAQTRDQQIILAQEFGLETPIVPNGIGTAADVPERETRRHDVLWVGSLKPVKQPLLVAEIARRLPHRTFTVVGGAGEDPAYHERAVRELSALPNVTVAGFVPPDQVGARYGDARLLLNTSLHEGFPNTYLYSWTRGTPVCALGVDPDGEVQQNGLGVIDADAERLAAGMEELLADTDRWRDCSARCLDWVAAAHGLDVMADAFLAAWRPIFAGGAGGRHDE